VSKEEWISAAEAFSILKPACGTYLARNTICKRAHHGLIRSRAQHFTMAGKSCDNVEIPKQFWWAEGDVALTQNWTAGDFDTWTPNQKTHMEAFGVSFLRAEIEKLLPARAFASSSPQAPAGSAVDDLSIVQRLALRFHESMPALKKHPHSGQTFVVKDEWDCHTVSISKRTCNIGE
jgi:hypothetical protein